MTREVAATVGMAMVVVAANGSERRRGAATNGLGTDGAVVANCGSERRRCGGIRCVRRRDRVR